MSEINRTIERLRQSTAARARDLASSVARPVSPESRLGASFQPGARVFDRVTGQEVEVLGGTTETIVFPTTERAKS